MIYLDRYLKHIWLKRASKVTLEDLFPYGVLRLHIFIFPKRLQRLLCNFASELDLNSHPFIKSITNFL